ncbi:hypothetical protein GCM10023258_19450 [Terrabacter aeriphilus]|uniref:Uncharacterized protein n=1 Tax=Terrabacter aeriphilus TaxID=515662 RepID=A0ABP9JCS3_9MICO
MGSVLVTYSTPPAPPDEAPCDGTPVDRTTPARTPPADAPGDRPDAHAAAVASAAPDVAATTAGIDEAIAAGITHELTVAGHRVACRPFVAAPPTDVFDLVVVVDGLRVSHREAGARRLAASVPPPAAPPGPPSPYAVPTGREDASIPLTWCADWRAVEAWSRTVGGQLAALLEVRAELARVRAELERCREQARSAARDRHSPTGLTPGHGGRRRRLGVGAAGGGS